MANYKFERISPTKAEHAEEFAPKVVTEKPHPMRRVPGFPRKAEWNKYQGRWVILRKGA
jgi:hypothetical protein